MRLRKQFELLMEWAIDVGWWEVTGDTGYWPGRFRTRFWRSPSNGRNRAVLAFVLSERDRLHEAYQLGLRHGQQAALLSRGTPNRVSLSPGVDAVWH